jgi:hypothetical protein
MQDEHERFSVICAQLYRRLCLTHPIATDQALGTPARFLLVIDRFSPLMGTRSGLAKRIAGPNLIQDQTEWRK